MLMKKNVITIIILIFYYFNVFPQKHINGLLFSSRTERISDRTSLILFDDKALMMKDAFRIDFDLTIWDIKQFGYILRVINETKQEINFAFVNFYGEDKIYLDFHSPITHKSVQIPITKQDIEEKRWLPISIIFDLKSDRAEVISKDFSYSCEPIGLKDPSSIKLAFGLYGLNLDVPEMAIRNIHIEEIGGKKYNIPLNEINGEKVRDDKGRVKGIVKNPRWLANRHFYWQEKARFKSDPMTGISYDEDKNQVIVVDKNSIYTYSMRYNNKRLYISNDLLPNVNSGETFYDEENEILYIYNLNQETQDKPTMAIVNMKNYSTEYGYARIGTELHHHNAFVGDTKKNLYIFGGYGNHSYSNKILKYDYKQDNWDYVEFTGDEIYPRYFSALGQGVLPSQILIMGGIGNESGKQEHGGRHLYDLFLLDMEAKQITKIWEIKDIQSGFVPCSNIILDDDKTHFYTLCYPQYQFNSTLQLYKFNIIDGSYEIVSDSIHINAEQIETSVYLFYNNLMQEFYAVIRENTENKYAEIRMYSLLSPPISFSELRSESKFSFYWLLLFSLILIPVVLFLKKKKQDWNIPTLHRNSQDKQGIQTKQEKDRKNSVFVFGDFTVYDKNGRDISYRFSPKLRSLFALILFYSVDKEGISTDMLTSELWMDKDTNSAKNTRGVTINRLRSILTDMYGITLFYQNSKWYFSFDTSFYCDYIKYKETINNIKNKGTDENENILKLFDILKRGALFPNLQENWIDAHKHEYENEVEKILWDYILKLHENKNYKELIKYTDLYFIIDPLNEDALKLYVHALQKLGKKDQSILLNNKFISNYTKSMGEKPDLT